MTIDNLLNRIRECCPLLASADEAMLRDILQSATLVDVSAGETILKQHQSVDIARIVLDGRLARLIRRGWGEQRILEHIELGETVCDAELIYENECRNDIRALQDSQLVCIPRAEFLRLVSAHSQILHALSERARTSTLKMLVTHYLSELLDVSKLGISDPLHRLQAEEEWLNFELDVVDRISNTAEWTNLNRGDYLFRQDDASDGAYILVSGVLRITVNMGDGKEHEISRVDQGEIVGELGLVTDADRSANVIAMRDCELFHLSATDFTHIAEKYPRVILNVYRLISRRFRKSITGSKHQPRRSNIAIITLSHNDAMDTLIDEFNRALAALDTTELLTSDIVDAHLGKTGITKISRQDPSNFLLMDWLNGREERSRFIVYRTDENWTEWNMRCISQAETILVFAEPSQRPEFDDLREHLGAPGMSWDLVLVHDEDTDRPRGSATLMEQAKADEIYHVRHRNRPDIERLARIHTGNAVSLVLGGGGARGFAFLGALRAMQELGIEVDMVGGTSIGAPIAGWVAQGRSAEECHQLARQAFRSLTDWTLPLVSLVRGRRISETITYQTGTWDIEDYWLPFFCVATNLTTGTQVIHRRGNSAKAIRSSVSIPGVLPPVPYGADLLVDGGVTNNIPINIMRDLNPAGTVIALDVAPPNGPRAREDYGLNISGWRQLFSRFIPWLKPARAPSIGSTILQSMMVGSSYLRNQFLSKKLADYYQNIHVRKVGMLDFNAVDRAENIGYESSNEPLKRWLEEKSNRS
jgi:predicted acylesterase/phospholipase RssA/CRP-like cAMP-binding protein